MNLTTLKTKIILFVTAFLQVFFVSANTYFIAKSYYIGVAIAGFMISFLWTSNIRKVAFGDMSDRLIYTTGAMIGGLVGLFISKQFLL